MRPHPRRPSDPRPPSLRYRFLARVVIGCMNLMRWKVDTQGLQHVPRRGGAVIAINHVSHVDFLVTALDIHRKLNRPIRFLAKHELWDMRWFGWLPRWVQAIPVGPSAHVDHRVTIEAALAALRDGDLVLVAPEGGISRSFELLPFHTGAVRMSSEAGVPLIPSVSWGSQRLSTTGQPVRILKSLGIPITVRFSSPLQLGQEEDVNASTVALRDRMTMMLEEVQRIYPDDLPAGAYWVPARLGGGATPHELVLRERGLPSNAGPVAHLRS